VVKGRTGVWAEFGKRNIPDSLKLFQWARLCHPAYRDFSRRRKSQVLLSKSQALDGGVIVLRKGMIKGMWAAFSTVFHGQRDAKRQLGSIFQDPCLCSGPWS